MEEPAAMISATPRRNSLRSWRRSRTIGSYNLGKGATCLTTDCADASLEWGKSASSFCNHSMSTPIALSALSIATAARSKTRKSPLSSTGWLKGAECHGTRTKQSKARAKIKKLKSPQRSKVAKEQKAPASRNGKARSTKTPGKTETR
jgi:hypothetical protein